MTPAKKQAALARAYDPITQSTSVQTDATLLRYLGEGPGAGAGMKPQAMIAFIDALARDGGAHEAFEEMIVRRRNQRGGGS